MRQTPFILLVVIAATLYACGEDETSDNASTTSDDTSGATSAGDTSSTDDAADGSTSGSTDTSTSDATTTNDALDDADTTPPPPPRAPSAYFTTHGGPWTAYVAQETDDPLTAQDAPCDQAMVQLGTQTCVHAGEIRAFDVPELVSCAGVTATDNLSAFDWICDDNTGFVRVISTGLKPNKSLTDLLDTEATPPTWRRLTVTATDGGQVIASDPAIWWPNPVVAVDRNMFFGLQQWDVGVITDTAFGRATALLPNVALVTKVGLLASPASTSGAIVSVSNYGWVEGRYSATNANGITVQGIYNRLLNVSIVGADSDAIGGQCTHCRFTNIDIDTCRGNGIDLYGGALLLENIHVANTTQSGMELSGLISTLPNTVYGFTSLNPGTYGFYTNNLNNLIMRDVLIANSVNQGLLINGNDLTFDRLTITNAGRGLNEVDCVEAITERSRFIDVSVSNCSGDGFWVRSATHDNIYVGLLSFGNGGMAVDDGRSNAGGHFWSDLTLAHNLDQGIDAASKISLMRAAIFHNAGDGLNLSTSDTMHLRDLAITNNGDDDIEISSSVNDNIAFEGRLVVTDPATSCSVSLGDPGRGLDNTCNPVGASTATVSAGTLTGAFQGPVSSDDTQNDSDIQGTRPFDAIEDWTQFESDMRGWSLDPPSADAQFGPCRVGGDCRILDLSLAAGANILNVLPAPTSGDEALVHTWWAETVLECERIQGAIWTGLACESTYLQNARELTRDDLGNNNGLCESNEACLHTPNIGAYQGHGALVEVGPITNGTLQNITLYRYASNGR